MSDVAAVLDHSPTHSLLAVLRIRDFRNLWLGLAGSSFGDWLGLLAVTALANQDSGQLAGIFGTHNSYQLANFAIAGVLFLRVFPALVITPLAGYVADKLDRRLTMIIGDFLRSGLVLSIPFVGRLWWVFAATALIEAVSLVWGPAKDATVPNLVPPHRLEAANQLSLATTYGSALPAALVFTLLSLLSAALTYSVGWFASSPVAIALFVDALTFAVSGVVISRLRTIPPGPASTHAEGPLSAIAEGWRFVMGTKLVRGLVFGIIGAFFAGGIIIGLARTFVGDLHGGQPAYGVLFGCVFAGLGLGMWRGPRLLQGLSRTRLFGVTLTGAGLMLFPIALIQNLVIVDGCTILLGFVAGVAWVTGFTTLGLVVPNEWRGRTYAFVGSAIRLALSIVLAVGPLAAGLIGRHRIALPHSKDVLYYNGAAITFLAAGIVMTAVGVAAYRQMDDRKGISLMSDLRQALTATPGVYSATGLFVAFEGGDGAGKSTQARLLADWLRGEGYPVVLTFQPGDTDVGRQVRGILLDPATGDLSQRTEALLYAADKAEHVDRLVAPALKRGEVVISDRYVDSVLAYQGVGRSAPPPAGGLGRRPGAPGGGLREIERVARWSTGDLRPHLTVLLDLDPAKALTRVEERDRIEGESLDFHQRVRTCFLQLAGAKPERYIVLDATLPAEQLAAAARQRVLSMLDGVHKPGEKTEETAAS